MVMVVNEFDLSVGSMASLGGVMAALMAVAGIPVGACFLATVVICMIIGWLNGYIIAKFKVLSFITTLGVSTILDGLIYRLTGGATVFENIPKSFSWLGTEKNRNDSASFADYDFVCAGVFIFYETYSSRKKNVCYWRWRRSSTGCGY